MADQNQLEETFQKPRRAYRILRRIQKGYYGSKIARSLDVSPVTVSHYTKKMEEKGWIELETYSSCKIYNLTGEGKKIMRRFKETSLPSRRKRTPKARIHNLAIKFPILEDSSSPSDWTRKNEMNNWTEYYDRVSYPIGLTFKKTPKNVVVYFHEFQASRKNIRERYINHVMKGIMVAKSYLKQKGVKVDPMGIKPGRQHIANDIPEFDENLDRGTTVEVNLNRRAQVAGMKSKQEAKAWIDHSLGTAELETNDMLYEEKLAAMPEMVYENVKAMKMFAKGMEQHMKLIKQLQDLTRSLKEIQNNKS